VQYWDYLVPSPQSGGGGGSSPQSGGGGGSSPQSGGGGGSSPQSGGGGGSSPQSGGGGGSSPQSGGGGGSSPQSGGDGSPGDWYNIYNTDGDGTNSYGYATLLENYKNDGTLAAIDGTTLDTSGVDPDVRANFVDLLQNKTRTGLWLDTYDSIDRLEAALEKGGFTKIIFLFYDLPNRDCAASSSNGQLCCTNFLNGASFCDAETMQSFAEDDAQPSRTYCLGLNDDMTQANPDASNTYTEYADKVVSIMADYPTIEFHIICEPDSWPNVITNSGLGENGNQGKKNCSLNTAALSYCAGIDYALRRLTGQIRNENGNIVQDPSDEGTTIYNMWKSGKIHTYLDIAHNAWMGWDLLTDANKGVMESLLKGIDKGLNSGVSAYQQIGNTDNWNNSSSPNSTVNGGTQQADRILLTGVRIC
jgi:hypothetical protein